MFAFMGLRRISSEKVEKIADYFSRDLENKSKRSYYNIGKSFYKIEYL